MHKAQDWDEECDEAFAALKKYLIAPYYLINLNEGSRVVQKIEKLAETIKETVGWW